MNRDELASTARKTRFCMHNSAALSIYETDGLNRSVVSVEFGSGRDAREFYDILKQWRVAK